MTLVGSCIDWAVCGRALPGQSVSGDVAVSVAGGDQTVLAVIDGLGHGPEAAAAAECARDVVALHPDEPPAALLRLCHAALAGTRGVAMTVAAVDCGSPEMRWVGVGNVRAKLVRRAEGAARLVTRALLYGGTVGYRLPDVRVSSVELRPGDLVIMATDGIGSGDFYSNVAVGQPVAAIAESILEHHGKPWDDALVAVARLTGQ